MSSMLLPRRVFSLLAVASCIFVLCHAHASMHPGFAGDAPPEVGASIRGLRVVSQRVSAPGYERENFGAGWAKAQHLGAHCTTRETVMAAAARAPVTVDGKCHLTGVAKDPYTGKSLEFGVSAVEVDHIFPLRAAWDLGAASWDPEKRRRFANDPMNLVATARLENQTKSDQLPSLWLPSSQRARCWYSRRLAEVAAAYELALPAADVRVMRGQCWVRELWEASLGLAVPESHSPIFVKGPDPG